MDLAKRFSLDHLVSGSAPTVQRKAFSTDLGPQSLDEAVSAYVSPVLKTLEAAPGNAQRLFSLFDSIREYVPQSDFGQFRDVIKYMQNQLRLIRIVEAGPHGDDLVQKV